jgi:hypothetical protein
MVENTEHGPMAFKFPNPEGTPNQHECTNQKNEIPQFLKLKIGSYVFTCSLIYRQLSSNPQKLYPLHVKKKTQEEIV